MGRRLAGLLDRGVAWRTGRRYHAHLLEYRAMERWPSERWCAWRSGRLVALLRHAAATVPYWGEVLGRLGAAPEDFRDPAALRALPPLTKAVINARGADLVSRAGPRGRAGTVTTGGSTGHRVWLRTDLETQDRRRAAGRLTEEWDGIGPGTRTAILWGAALDSKPSRAARLYDRLTGQLFLSAYGVGDDEVRRYFDRLAAFRPEVISAYPSLLLDAGRRAGRERCRGLGVRVIYTSAEALFEPVREELADLFGAAVRNRYAAREFGLIASDCPTGGGLHVADMRLVLEAGEQRPDGAAELLVTDLDNHVMPLIRYAIEDAAQFAAGPCPCGRTLSRLTSLEGRAFDVVRTPDGRAFGGTFFTLVFRHSTVRQAQVVQDRADHLRVSIVPGPGYDTGWRERLRADLAAHLGPEMGVDLVECAEIPPLASGKRRFVVSEVARP